jgi:uncharacterized protein (DUF1800 family)
MHFVVRCLIFFAGVLAVIGCSGGIKIVNHIAGPSSTRLLATAQFTATVAGSGNQTVTWQVNTIAGGNSTIGTISTVGLYTSPVTMPSPTTVAISAIDSTSSTLVGSITESLWNPTPVVSRAIASQVETSQSYLVDVIGTGFIPTSSIQVGGSSITTRFLSATELQATIPVAANTTSIAVAVSNPDPGASLSVIYNVPISIALTSLSAAARLLDQTSFGPTSAGMQHVRQLGVDGYLAEQFATPTTPLAAIPTNHLPLLCRAINDTVVCAEAEWWKTAITASDQLRQRVAFAMSEMFVVSTLAIPAQSIPAFHNALANDAFSNFRTLMQDVTLSEAMGAYLNMLNSAKPADGEIANENYPRELMQLFTTGLYLLNQDGSAQTDSLGNPIPAYTEANVQAFARAYTGWSYGVAGGGKPIRFPSAVNWIDPMQPFENEHDTTSKVLLNGTTLPAGQTALQDLNGALDNIFNSPNVGPFVGTQLIQHLVTSTPSPAYVSRISAVFANNGSGVRGDMKAVINAILTDPEARAGDTNAEFDGGHLREPILFITAMVRGLGFTNTEANGSFYSLTGESAKLNEEPYRANSVFNFFAPNNIIPGTKLNAPEFAIENTATAMLRLNLADSLVNNKIANFNVDLSATSMMGLMAANPATLVDTLSMLFMHSQMPTGMRSSIINAITPLSSNTQRARRNLSCHHFVAVQDHPLKASGKRATLCAPIASASSNTLHSQPRAISQAYSLSGLSTHSRAPRPTTKPSFAFSFSVATMRIIW